MFLDGTRIPSLILLDIHMPEMDGFEVLRRLKEQPAYEKVPVIFLTADDDAGTEKKGLEAGAADFIQKPFVAEFLLSTLSKTDQCFFAVRRIQSTIASALTGISWGWSVISVLSAPE